MVLLGLPDQENAAYRRAVPGAGGVRPRLPDVPPTAPRSCMLPPLTTASIEKFRRHDDSGREEGRTVGRSHPARHSVHPSCRWPGCDPSPVPPHSGCERDGGRGNWARRGAVSVNVGWRCQRRAAPARTRVLPTRSSRWVIRERPNSDHHLRPGSVLLSRASWHKRRRKLGRERPTVPGRASCPWSPARGGTGVGQRIAMHRLTQLG